MTTNLSGRLTGEITDRVAAAETAREAREAAPRRTAWAHTDILDHRDRDPSSGTREDRATEAICCGSLQAGQGTRRAAR